MIYTISICRSITFTRQLHKMVRLSKNPPANSRWIVWCLFVFEHFVGLAPKGLPLRFWWKKVYVSLYTISTWSKRGLINDLQIVSGATIVTACAWRCLTVSLFTFQFYLFHILITWQIFIKCHIWILLRRKLPNMHSNEGCYRIP